MLPIQQILWELNSYIAKIFTRSIKSLCSLHFQWLRQDFAQVPGFSTTATVSTLIGQKEHGLMLRESVGILEETL